MFAINDKPRFIHDCSKCMYLGNYKSYDIYYCVGILGGSVVARYGDEAAEYTSAPVSCVLSDESTSEISTMMSEIARNLLHSGFVKIEVNMNVIKEKEEDWNDYWKMRKS
jgi:hypothetical protein